MSKNIPFHILLCLLLIEDTRGGLSVDARRWPRMEGGLGKHAFLSTDFESRFLQFFDGLD